ncbi:MAG: DUF4271 domain-containing protein [Bacteroidaceae bacterium]
MTISPFLSAPMVQVPDSIDAIPIPQETDSIVLAGSDATQSSLPLNDSLVHVLTHFQESDKGFFHGTPYWHPEIPGRTLGFACSKIPYRVSTDSPLTCGVLICFVMLMYILIRYGHEMRSQLHDFFLPTRARQGRRQALSTAQGLLSMPYVCLMLSIMGGIAISVIEQDRLGQMPYLIGRLSLQAIYVVSWWIYFLCKAYLYNFLNWIFFNKQVRHEWHNTQFLILTFEAVTLFPILLVMVYTYPPKEVFIGSILCVITLAKFLLLFKAIRLFYVKIYGALHLFVYFCTLEVAPLWVTIEFLTQITDLL